MTTICIFRWQSYPYGSHEMGNCQSLPQNKNTGSPPSQFQKLRWYTILDTKWQYTTNEPNFVHLYEKLASKSYFYHTIAHKCGNPTNYVQNALKNWVNLSRLRFFFSIVPCQNQHNQRWRTRRGPGIGPNRFVLQLFTSGSHLGVQHLCKHAPKTTSIFWGYFHAIMNTGENLFFIANMNELVESSCTLAIFGSGFADVFRSFWHIFLTKSAGPPD